MPAWLVPPFVGQQYNLIKQVGAHKVSHQQVACTPQINLLDTFPIESTAKEGIETET